MATKRAKNIKKETPKANSITRTAKELNNFVYETSEVLVDEAFETGAQWQGVAEKAIKGGLKLAENQTDVMFKVLESMKKQIKGSRTRFQSIIQNN